MKIKKSIYWYQTWPYWANNYWFITQKMRLMRSNFISCSLIKWLKTLSWQKMRVSRLLFEIWTTVGQTSVCISKNISIFLHFYWNFWLIRPWKNAILTKKNWLDPYIESYFSKTPKSIPNFCLNQLFFGINRYKQSIYFKIPIFSKRGRHRADRGPDQKSLAPHRSKQRAPVRAQHHDVAEREEAGQSKPTQLVQTWGGTRGSINNRQISNTTCIGHLNGRERLDPERHKHQSGRDSANNWPEHLGNGSAATDLALSNSAQLPASDHNPN